MPATGTVLTVHDRAVTRVVSRSLWTLLPATVRPGPRRLLLAGSPLRLPLRTGHAVHVRAGRLAVGRCVVDGRVAGVWTPAPLPPASPGAAARLAGVGLGVGVGVGRAWPGVRP